MNGGDDVAAYQRKNDMNLAAPPLLDSAGVVNAHLSPPLSAQLPSSVGGGVLLIPLPR